MACHHATRFALRQPQCLQLLCQQASKAESVRHNSTTMRIILQPAGVLSPPAHAIQSPELGIEAALFRLAESFGIDSGRRSLLRSPGDGEATHI